MTFIDRLTVRDERIKKLEKENSELRRGIKAALNHVCSYAFIEGYKNNVDKDQKEDWVPAVYVREITSFVTVQKKCVICQEPKSVDADGYCQDCHDEIAERNVSNGCVQKDVEGKQ